MKSKLKIAIVVVAALVLTGCGAWERTVANMTGWARVCVDGVSYLQFTSGVTVEYTRDGKIKVCKS